MPTVDHEKQVPYGGDTVSQGLVFTSRQVIIFLAVVAVGAVGIGFGAGFGVGKAAYEEDGDDSVPSTAGPEPSTPPTPTSTPTAGPTPAPPTLEPTPAPTPVPTIAPETCGDGEEVKISAIQGTGHSSPMQGEVVVVEAVYTGSNTGGFFLQEELEDYSGTNASEGIYVKGSINVARNTLVRLSGKVVESYGMTALTDAGPATECPLKKTLPTVQRVAVDGSVVLEEKEGMLIEVASEMVITNTYNTWKYGELECGPQLRYKPTEVAVPLSSEYDAVVAGNKRGTFVVEDSATSQYPSMLTFYPYLPMYQRPINIGAKVTNVTGPLMYSYGKWRTNPLTPVTLENNRPSASAIEGFRSSDSLVIGSFNVLNYFNGQVVNGQVTFNFSANRGAKSQAQFELQSAKIVNALYVMDADIVGLMEIENDGFGADSALAALTTQLNAKFADTSKHYSFVSLPNATQIGTDAITCGLLYRPAAVSLSGDAWIIDMPQQKFVMNDETTLKQMRPALVQTFIDKTTGINLTLAVNHFKSKGSECYEDLVASPSLLAEIQGSCNAFRVNAAVALGDGLASASNVADRVMILGDLNSNGMEDPLAVLTTYDPATRGYTIMSAEKVVADIAAPEGTIASFPVTKTYDFTNVAARGFSYVYSGEVGSLDFMLANDRLAAEVQSAMHWNINSIELYQMTYFQAYANYPGYANQGVHRSSDHDPVVVAVQLPSPPGVLVISEYIEGSGFTKAIEIANVGGSPIDFAKTPYKLGVFRMGSTQVNEAVSLSGVLAPGDVLIVAHSSAPESLLAAAASQGQRVMQTSALGFNGDDAVALMDASGTVTDLVGVIPMTNNFLKDITLRRSGDDRQPNSQGFASVSKSVFNLYAKDTVDGFGCIGFFACLPVGETHAPPVPVGMCGDGEEVKISAIQGTGYSSPIQDQVVVVEAVYTGSNKEGFFLQEEVEDYSGTNASEGIYVKGSINVARNTLVRLSGKVVESYGMTALTDAGPATECPLKKTLPTVQRVAVDGSVVLEEKEGMLIEVASEMMITNTFNTWKYGELECGPQLRYKPSEVAVPLSSEYDAVVAGNKRGTFVVEGFTSFYTNVTFNNPVNIGAKVTNVAGPLMYSYGKWRTNPLTLVTLENNRPSASAIEGFNATDSLVIGSFNVLNYFNGQVVNGQVTFSYAANRGAKSQAQFELQSAKIVNALYVMDADIVGLMEIENDGFGADSALAALTTQLNAKFADTSKHYSFVSLPNATQIGTDAITCGLLYRPAAVSLSGDAWIIDMPQQKFVMNDETTLKQMRPALVQTFIDRTSGTDITLAVNHFKSKGSECYEDLVASPSLLAEIQGSCNAFRVNAAVALGDGLASASNVADRVMILGDLNSNGMEDPLAVLTTYDPATRGYTIMSAEKVVADIAAPEGTIASFPVTKTYDFNNVAAKGFSYVYSGEVGSLDFVLANDRLAAEVQSAMHWNINSIELYQMTYFQALSNYPGYADEGVYRSSDHDPVVVAVNFQSSNPAAPATTAPDTAAPPLATLAPTDAPVSTTPSTSSGQLIFTEYTEGSSFNKAVELTNMGNAAIDFAATPYTVRVHFSGGSNTAKVALTSSTLAPGASLIIAHTSMSADFFTKPSVAASLVVQSGSLSFNGDDSVALVDAADNVQDVIGTFPMSSKWLANLTIRRAATDVSGNPTGFTEVPTGPWTVVATTSDSFDDLVAGFGCAGVAAC